jgi:hypothetical protein
MKPQCEKCGKGFKTLTKEGLCAFCHFEEHEEWAREFSDENMKKGAR